jgi:hypothetical protein
MRRSARRPTRACGSRPAPTRSRPFAGRLRFPDRSVAANNQYWHAHGTWERAPARGATWNLTAGWARLTSGSPDAPSPTVSVIERLRDGPVLETVLPTSGAAQRLNTVVRVRPDLSGVAGGRQTLDLGGSVSRTSSSEDAMPRAVVGNSSTGCRLARGTSRGAGDEFAARNGTGGVGERPDLHRVARRAQRRRPRGDT